MGHVVQEDCLGAVCRLRHVKCSLNFILLFLKLHPKFRFLLPLLLYRFRILRQFSVDTLQFPVAEAIAYQRDNQANQKRNREYGRQNMLTQKIHYGKWIHLPCVCVGCLVEKIGVKQGQATVHQQHETKVVLRECHAEFKTIPGPHRLQRMVFARLQQRIRPKTIEKRAVRRACQ